LSYKQKFSSKDPVWILHRFSRERDIELIGLITAAYAYGSVDQINRFIEDLLQKTNRFIEDLLQKTGNKPYEFTINFSKRKDKKHLDGLYYRFNSQFDLLDMFSSLNRVLVNYGSLKNLFLIHFSESHSNIIPALTEFTKELNRSIPKAESSYYH